MAVDLRPWLSTLVSGAPHIHIGGTEDPYLLRWYLIPRNKRVNVYLHKFVRSDDDRALHDHPWWFVSLVLKGRYAEYTPDDVWVRRPGSLAYRSALSRHRVELQMSPLGEIPCWTLIVTGRVSRKWGFWCASSAPLDDHFVAHENWDALGCGEL